jgi:exodeoxyribonuclease VII small subunit
MIQQSDGQVKQFRALGLARPSCDHWLMNYEKSLRRLDEIAASLENEQIGLDQSLKLFEEGIELLRSASAELDKAETKVQMLIEKSGGGFELKEMDL